MDDTAVELLVHISAPCSHADDSRYRKQARELLAFLEKSPEATERSISPPSEPRESITDSTQELSGSDSNVEHDKPATDIDTRLYTPFHAPPAKQAMNRDSLSAAAALVQIEMTPALSRKRTPLHRWLTAPAIVKETPSGIPHGRDRVAEFHTPPGTVPDSQPSHASLKRAFLEDLSSLNSFQEDNVLVEPPPKRARTEPPSPMQRTSGLHALRPQSSPSPAKRGQDNTDHHSVLNGRTPDPQPQTPASSPYQQSQSTTDLYGVSNKSSPHVQPQINLGVPIFEDEEIPRLETGPQQAPQSSLPHPHPLQSSQSSPNRQPPSSSDNHNSDSPTKQSSPSSTNRLTLAAARQAHLLRNLPPSARLASAPRPSTSDETYTTHLTPTLSMVRARFQPLSRYYAPISQSRPVRALERGYWSFTVPCSWTSIFLTTFWTRLQTHIQRGKAGFGTRAERILDGQEQGTSQGREDAFRAEDVGLEKWRVWCWGEVLVEVWLLLYIDSNRAIRGAKDVSWRDAADGQVVVQM